jgi:hypothetical protein
LRSVVRRLGIMGAKEPVHAFPREPLLPSPYRVLIDAGAALDLGGAEPVRRQQNDPSPPNVLLRTVPVRHHRFQASTVGGAAIDVNAASRRAKLLFAAKRTEISGE